MSSSRAPSPPAKRHRSDPDAHSAPPSSAVVVKNKGSRAIPGDVFHTTAHRTTRYGFYEGGAGRCVIKEHSASTTSRRAYRHEEANFAAAVPILEAFQRQHCGRGHAVQLRIHEPAIWTYDEGPKKGARALVEPFLPTFRKFNSNTGVSALLAASASTGGVSQVAHPIPDALTHFSFHHTSGERLLCGLQGQVGEGAGGAVRYTFTGVAICSRVGERNGETDMGGGAMKEFFRRHVCGAYCARSWRKWDGGSSSAGGGSGRGSPSVSEDFVPSMRTRFLFSGDKKDGGGGRGADAMGRGAGAESRGADVAGGRGAGGRKDDLAVSEDEDEDDKEEEFDPFADGDDAPRVPGRQLRSANQDLSSLPRIADHRGAPLPPRPARRQGDDGFSPFLRQQIQNSGVLQRAPPGSYSSVLLPHQRVLRYTMENRYCDRLLVDWRTGSGKTLGMIAVLTAAYSWKVGKVVIVPNAGHRRNFLEQVLRWPSPWRDFFAVQNPALANEAAGCENWVGKRYEEWKHTHAEMYPVLEDTLVLKNKLRRGQIQNLDEWQRDPIRSKIRHPGGPLLVLTYAAAGGRQSEAATAAPALKFGLAPDAAVGSSVSGESRFPFGPANPGSRSGQQRPVSMWSFVNGGTAAGGLFGGIGGQSGAASSAGSSSVGLGGASAAAEQPQPTNVYDKKLVLLDEAHNLIRELPRYQRKLEAIRRKIYAAGPGTLAAFFTATPGAGSDDCDPRALLRVVKGAQGAGDSDEGYSMFYEKNVGFPEVRSSSQDFLGVPNSYKRATVCSVMLGSAGLARAAAKDLRLQHLATRERQPKLSPYMNCWVPAQTLGRVEYQTKLKEHVAKYAPKLAAILQDIRQSPDLRHAVLISRRGGFNAMRLVLEDFGRKLDPRGRRLALLADLNEFNRDSHGKEFFAILLDVAQCGEGISVEGVNRQHMAELPSCWELFLQWLGRTNRQGSHQGLAEDNRWVEARVYISTYPAWMKSDKVKELLYLTLLAKHLREQNETALEAAVADLRENLSDDENGPKEISREGLLAFSFGKWAARPVGVRRWEERELRSSTVDQERLEAIQAECARVEGVLRAFRKKAFDSGLYD